MELGRLDKASEAFGRSSELDGADPRPHYYLGLVFERWNRFDAALAAFRTAASLDVSDPQYAIASAEMLINLDRLGEAERSLDAAAERFEHNAGVRQTAGHLAMMRDRPEEAVRHFDAACLLAPDEEGLIEDLARAQIAAGLFADAEYSLSRLLRDHVDPQSRRDLVHLRARCLQELDRPVRARELYKQLIRGERGAADVDAWIGLGRAELTLGNAEGAASAGRRLSEFAPHLPDGPLLRAMALERMGETEGAIGALAGAENLERGVAGLLLLRARLLVELGERGRALAAAEEALRREPGLAVARELVSSLESVQPAAEVTAVPTGPDG
jgi:tetratricopeptide (TPR) repeat protein